MGHCWQVLVHDPALAASMASSGGGGLLHQASAVFTNASCAFLSLWEQPAPAAGASQIDLVSVSLMTYANFSATAAFVSERTGTQLTDRAVPLSNCAGLSCNAANLTWLRVGHLQPDEQYVAIQTSKSSEPLPGGQHVLTLIQALTAGVASPRCIAVAHQDDMTFVQTWPEYLLAQTIAVIVHASQTRSGNLHG